MKRAVFVLLALLMAIAVMIPACGGGTPTPPTPPAPPAEQPQYGGILKAAYTWGPRVLGYYPAMGFTDLQSVYPYAESMVNMDGKGNSIPELAASWDVDTANKTITWHLRQGVKFHDGTDWNAEAAKWTYDETIAAGRLKYGELITSIEVIDDYTLRFNLSQYNNRLVQAYGYMVCFFSPTAFNANGGKDWARDHPVGTGPFKVVDFKRDAYLKLEKNESYWRPSRPYLDGIDIRFIGEKLTAMASLQAGEIDFWHDTEDVDTVIKLDSLGFPAVTGGVGLLIIVPSAKNPDSPFANKKVREAVEYALDREAMAKTFTKGFGEAAYQCAPSWASIYDPDFKSRKYDPEKAKQLLAEAGYADGFQTSIAALAFGGVRDYATAAQNYLAAVGITAEVEAVDMGRLMVMEEEGWNGLMVNIVMESSPNYIVPFLDNFGPLPAKYFFASFGRSPEYEALCQQVQSAQDDESERVAVQKLIRQAAEDATVIPLFVSQTLLTVQPYVHPYLYEETGTMATSFFHEWWMEKH